MKTKKMFLLFAAFIFAAVAIYNIHLAQSNQNSDISLADITIMVKADTEIPPTITCNQYPGYMAQCWYHDPVWWSLYLEHCRWSGNQFHFCYF